MKKKDINRLFQRSLCAVLVLLLAFPAVTGASSPGEGIRGADGNPLSSTAVYAGTGEYADEDGDRNDAVFRSPGGVLVLKDGSVLVADTMNHRIRQIREGAVSTFAGLALFSTDLNEQPIGALLDGDQETAVFYEPRGLTADRHDNVYVADTGNHAIRKISTDGKVTIVAGDGSLGKRDGEAGQARFYGPSAVAVAEDGMIYVADTLNHLIRSVTPDGTVTTLNAASDRLVEVSPGDVIEAGGYRDGSLQQALFNEPSGLALDAEGNLYVADSGNHLIRYVNLANKTVSTIAGQRDVAYAEQALYAAGGYRDGAVQEARFHFPKGIAITDEGGLIVADSLNHSVRYVLDGQVMTLAGNGVRGNTEGINGINQLEFPTDVAIRSDGSVLVADTYNNQIRLFSLYQLPSSVTDQQIDIVVGTHVIRMDTLPEMIMGRTMVPVRAVSEHLGYNVEYDTDTQSISLEKNDTLLFLTVGEKELQVQKDGEKQTFIMDVAPYVKEGRTYVPLRFFSEAFGYDVEWDQATRTVILR